MHVQVNRQWRLARRPVGLAKTTDFEWRETPLPVPGPGQALVRNRHLMLGAGDRQWMREEETYLPALQLGQVVRGIAIGTVVQSNRAQLPIGARVMGAFGWQDFALTDGSDPFFFLLPNEVEVSETDQLGLFSPVGVAAYFGITEVGRPAAGDMVVVSAAAGATGSLAGQIAKRAGCRVIGIAGSDEKCHWIAQELGFDAAINYKKAPVFRRLRECCPHGIDVFFDGVGGSILEDVLNLLNTRARIVACGMISVYNDLGATLAYPAGPNNLLNLVIRRGRMEGFVCLDYWPRAHEAFTALAQWQREGTLKCRIELVEGLRNAPRAMNCLFEGSNRGRLVLQV